MPYVEIEDGIRLYYELSGLEDGPVILQLGGGLFGRHNFGFVSDRFREDGFRLLSFDARGHGASSAPRERYTIEGWAEDAAGLLGAVGLERARARYLDGRHDRHRAHRAPPRARDRRLRRRRLRQAGRLPASSLPCLVTDG
ncbi:MAG: hypothetical protein C4306_03070 [Thermoleophilia bacterium]